MERGLRCMRPLELFIQFYRLPVPAAFGAASVQSNGKKLSAGCERNDRTFAPASPPTGTAIRVSFP